jgi:hypothetical protein
MAAAAPATPKMIGIHVGAVSFVDDSVEKVLDVFQRDASINTLFVATFTYGRGIAGRQLPGQPLPDHGKQEYDAATFHGGSYTRIRPSSNQARGGASLGPQTRNEDHLLLGMVEDYARSYDIDGIMWGSERQAAFANALGSSHGGASQDPAGVTCFWEFCERQAKERGIDPARAREALNGTRTQL